MLLPPIHVNRSMQKPDVAGMQVDGGKLNDCNNCLRLRPARSATPRGITWSNEGSASSLPKNHFLARALVP